MDFPERFIWTALGFFGAGLSVGIRLGRGETVNPWAVLTTLGAGAAVGGTATEALVKTAHLEPFWAGMVALLLGVTAMGFVTNALDGKIPLLNKFMGGADGGDDKTAR